MTKSNIFQFLFLTALALVTILSCTDPEQQKMMEQNKQLQEQHEDAAPAATEAPTESQRATQEDEAVHSEEQPAPTYKVYHFTSSTEHTAIECTEDGSLQNCGASFTNCGKEGNHEYHCQTGVHEWTTEEPAKSDN